MTCHVPALENEPFVRKISQFQPEALQQIDLYLQHLLQQEDPALRKTHYFHGRFENLYVESNEYPLLQELMQESLYHAAELLCMSPGDLKLGYWFNLMMPGQLTTLHRHDDLDELLSGVVYLTVPEDSGHLVIMHQHQQIEVEPVMGHYIYFDPATPHQVTENRSNHHRLSIGMNIGSKVSAIDD